MKRLLNALRSLPRVNYRYQGNPVGSRVSGNYGNMPKPAPFYYVFTQGPVDLFMTSIWGMWAVITLSAWFGPIFLLPFWNSHKRALREAADNYGPLRYGASQADIA